MRELAKLAAALFIVLTVLAVGTLDKPPEENRTAVTAATVAAAREYDRVLKLHGDREAAQWASDRVYEEVLAGWE